MKRSVQWLFDCRQFLRDRVAYLPGQVEQQKAEQQASAEAVVLVAWEVAAGSYSDVKEW